MQRREALRRALLGAGSLAFGKALVRIKEIDLLSELNVKTSHTDDYWKLVKEQFQFHNDLLYFNNASLGATPFSVIEKTHAYRMLLHRYPSRYMWGGWKDEKEEVRKKVSVLLGANPDEIALTHNTTEGMNIIASSIQLREGDEVIVGNHEHFTARIPWEYYQERKGIKIVKPQLPLVPQNKKEIIELYENAITDKTRVISLVHMTNTNGMMLPVKEISEIAHARDILVAVDGAQSVASFPIDLHDLGCDYFAASAHKWLFSPKGMGILYCRKEADPQLQPLIANRKWKDETMRRVEDYNTRNLPELLGLGDAIDFHNAIGTDKISERHRELRDYFIKKVKKSEAITVHTPLQDDLSLQILGVEKQKVMFYKLKKNLFDQHNIEVRSMGSHDIGGVRISLAIFNTHDEIDLLVEALVAQNDQK